MPHIPRLTTVGRLVVAVGILAGLLLLAGTGPAAAETAAPHSVGGFPNAPGWITVTWGYDGDPYDVDKFLIKRQDPDGSIVDAGWADAGRRDFTDKFLQASTSYQYFVCAYSPVNEYGLIDYACSDLSTPITTLAPQQPPTPPGTGGSSGGTPPPARPAPQPLYSPVIRARPAGTELVHLTWQNPLSAQQRTLLTDFGWYRDGTYFNGGTVVEEMVDHVQPGATHRYKLCMENAINRICSAEISAGPAGVAASFESLNVAGHFIRHRFSLGELTRLTSGLDFADATFVLRPGLNGMPGTVSFESVNYPGHFLRHQNYRLKLSRDDGANTSLFRQDASFLPRPGRSGTPGTVSFESVNLPGHFIRHQNFELWLANKDAGNTALFPQDVSFWQQLGRSAWP